MTRIYRFRYIVALCCGAGATTLCWFLTASDSSFELASPGLSNAIALINIIPFILGMVIGGVGPCGPSGREATYWGLVFVQWFVIGFGVAFLFRGNKKLNAPPVLTTGDPAHLQINREIK
jgi:hypothetical protein